MKHTLPKLNYSFDALEPYIDTQTMEIHYTRHHQVYIDKLNIVVENNPSLTDKNITEMLANLESLNLDPVDKLILNNHGGGHANHTFFWSIMGPKKQIDSNLENRIKSEFGSVEIFKKKFENASLAHFGSGWAWLVENSGKKLEIYSTSNQDSPLLSGHTPIIALDLWEHAYYLKYQNMRAEYIKNWWNTVKILP